MLHNKGTALRGSGSPSSAPLPCRTGEGHGATLTLAALIEVEPSEHTKIIQEPSAALNVHFEPVDLVNRECDCPHLALVAFFQRCCKIPFNIFPCFTNTFVQQTHELKRTFERVEWQIFVNGHVGLFSQKVYSKVYFSLTSTMLSGYTGSRPRRQLRLRSSRFPAREYARIESSNSAAAVLRAAAESIPALRKRSTAVINKGMKSIVAARTPAS